MHRTTFAEVAGRKGREGEEWGWKTIILSRLWNDYRRSFGLDIGFIDHFTTQLVITLNYRTIADFHTLQLIRAHRLVFSVSY
jgi:hypothetical protein